jgi:hypothetical protein
MRISDDRYSRDRLRLDLALRFIHHEARTHTIRAWTGLTDDRIAVSPSAVSSLAVREDPSMHTVARGALLCEAFEAYTALMGESQISFEHAVYLLSALLAGDELRVAHCRDCSSVLVTDRLALRIPVCNECSARDPYGDDPAGGHGAT